MKNKNKNQNPLVSVIMPVYNAGNFLMKAIESILNQTYQNFEFIIVDDASTDNSWEIIQKYTKKYPQKIKAFQLKKTLNRGGDACANFALKKAKGKYIVRMDADDIAHPKRLEKQVEFLEKNKNVFLVGSNAWVIDKKGKKIGEKKVPTSYQEIYKQYFIFHPIIHPSVMFRKYIKGKKFFYPKKFSANNDYYVFFNLLLSGFIFKNLEEKLLYYRIHGKNDTFSNMREKFFNTLKIRFLMVKKGYEPDLKQWLTCFLQSFLFLLLPEKFLKFLYLISRGIIKIDFKKNFFPKLSFLKKANLAFSTK
jgi:glycosyltransferase involved in cell wall biosynthesis